MRKHNYRKSSDGGLQQPSDRRQRSIVIVVLLGFALTLWAYLMVRSWEQGIIDSEFQRRANNHAVVLQTMIDKHVALLDTLAGLYTAVSRVERKEFQRFVLPLLARHPEIKAYSWNPVVKLEERDSFEASARQQGLPQFQITEVDENGNRIAARVRPEYVSVFHLEPYTENEPAIGFDIASEPKRRAALDDARDSGQVITTDWIRLVQETGDQYGVLIVHPVYTAGAEIESIQQRRDALQGFVVGVFRIGDMIEAALHSSEPAGLDFWVHPDSDSEHSALSYFHPSRSRKGGTEPPRFRYDDVHHGHHLHLTLQLPGVEWGLQYKAAPAFYVVYKRYAATGVLLSGSLLTTLLGFYLFSLRKDSRQMASLNASLVAVNAALQHEVAERAEAERALITSEQVYRTLIETAPEAITILDVDSGHLTEINQQAEQLFGMSREELLRLGPADLSPEIQPDGRRSAGAARKYIQRAIDGGNPVFEWTHRHASGENIPCEVRLARLPDREHHRLVRGTIVDIRDRKRAEGLRERLGRILDNSSNEIYIFNADSLRFLQVNACACANLGYSAEELSEMTPTDVEAEVSESVFQAQIARLRHGEINQVRFRTAQQRKDGTKYPVEITLQLSINENPQVFVAIVQDISERLAAEDALRESESYNRTLFEESPIGLVLCDLKGNFVDVNPAFASMVGRTSDELCKLDYWQITPENYTLDEQEQLERLAHEGRYGPYEKEYLHKNGHLVPVRLNGRILLKAGKEYIWSSVEDITDYKQARERIDHLAFHDVLTDLPNRELLRDRLDHAIHLAHRNKTLVGLMFIDIDRFKTINDTLGHGVGDQLLKQVADRLTNTVREADTVARFGGDEFIVIAEGVSSRQQLDKLASGIMQSIREPFKIDERELFVTASIGIAVAAAGGANADTLIAQADVAMYSAKETGRNHHLFHSPNMGEHISRRAAIESDLRGALERDELRLHLQPILDLKSGQVVAMEALMRWQHQERGLVSPGEFIPVMEDSGMIAPASRWALEGSCRYLSAVRQSTGQDLAIAVNFSAPCFSESGITTHVRQTLAKHDVAPGSLIIEITESTLFRDPQSVRPVLESLKALGVRIALDDFGTGQSSLSHLRNFPIDIVKIDRGFIRDVPNDPNDCELVAAIIAMAHKLNLCVVAEGIENETQLAFLRAHDCDRIQGFLFSRPLPAEEMSTYLADRAEKRVVSQSA